MKTLKLEKVLTTLLDAGLYGLGIMDVANFKEPYTLRHFSAYFCSTQLSNDISSIRKQGIAIDSKVVGYYNVKYSLYTEYKRYRLRDRNAAYQVVKLINDMRYQRREIAIPDHLTQILVNQFPEKASWFVSFPLDSD